MTMTQAELDKVFELHGQWLSGSGGKRADLRDALLTRADLTDAVLRGADLTGAVLTDAVLRGADLTGAVLTRADLRDAVLTRADLTYADLTAADLTGADLTRAVLTDADLRGADLTDAVLRGMGADLTGADLRDAVLPTGETWEKYLSDVVPVLLTAGGRPLAEVATAEHWACHSWDNCPMAAAFECDSIDGVPVLHRPRAEQFIQFFDARLIPLPEVTNG